MCILSIKTTNYIKIKNKKQKDKTWLFTLTRYSALNSVAKQTETIEVECESHIINAPR